MVGRESDNPIVSMKLGNASGEKGLHIIAFEEDTLTAHRGGYINRNEIDKNSKDCKGKTSRKVYFTIPFTK